VCVDKKKKKYNNNNNPYAQEIERRGSDDEAFQVQQGVSYAMACSVS